MSTKPRLPSKVESTQARGVQFVGAVLDATILQMAQVGFEKLSIPQIAKLSGVNKTSIYRRWPSKNELVQDALKAAMRHTEAALDTGQLRGDLIALSHSVATFMQSPIGRAVINILLAEGSNSNLRSLALAAYGKPGEQGPWLAINRAKQRGELKRPLDPSLLLFTIAGAIMHRVLVEQRDASPAFLEQLIDLVLLGVTTGE